MAVIILFAPLLAAFVLVLVALFSRPAAARARVDAQGVARPRLAPAELRALVDDLLEARGFRVEADAAHGSPDEPSQRLLATRAGSWTETRHVVFVEAAPPADVVDAATILELAEQVKTEPGSVGLLITPYAVDHAALAGLEARLEVVDGAMLRAIVKRELPRWLPALDAHGVGATFAARQTAPAPDRRAGSHPLAST
jgi:hypothetical protein